MLWNGLDRYRDVGLLIARLGFGLGFVWYHGLPKLMGGMERMTVWEGRWSTSASGRARVLRRGGRAGRDAGRELPPRTLFPPGRRVDWDALLATNATGCRGGLSEGHAPSERFRCPSSRLTVPPIVTGVVYLQQGSARRKEVPTVSPRDPPRSRFPLRTPIDAGRHPPPYHFPAAAHRPRQPSVRPPCSRSLPRSASR
jgi:hypothetical protein